MKLTNGKEIVELFNDIQIQAFKNKGWTEVVVKKPRKNEVKDKD